MPTVTPLKEALSTLDPEFLVGVQDGSSTVCLDRASIQAYLELIENAEIPKAHALKFVTANAEHEFVDWTPVRTREDISISREDVIRDYEVMLKSNVLAYHKEIGAL